MMYARENQNTREISLHEVCTMEESECKKIGAFF